jgi:hypothetical protein
MEAKRTHFWRMSRTITIRVKKDLAQWLEETASRTGVSQGQLVRDQLEKARAGGTTPAFMRVAGFVSGPKDLSTRKGFDLSARELTDSNSGNYIRHSPKLKSLA